MVGKIFHEKANIFKFKFLKIFCRWMHNLLKSIFFFNRGVIYFFSKAWHLLELMFLIDLEFTNHEINFELKSFICRVDCIKFICLGSYVWWDMICEYWCFMYALWRIALYILTSCHWSSNETSFFISLIQAFECIVNGMILGSSKINCKHLFLQFWGF